MEVEAFFKIREDNIRVSSLDSRYIESIWVLEQEESLELHVMLEISSIVCQEPYNIDSVSKFYKLMDQHLYRVCRVRATIITVDDNPSLRIAVCTSVVGFCEFDVAPKFRKGTKVLVSTENSESIVGYVADVRVNYFNEYEYMVLLPCGNIVSRKTSLLDKFVTLPVWYEEPHLVLRQ